MTDEDGVRDTSGEPESINAWLKRLAAEAPPPSDETVELIQRLLFPEV